MTQPNCSSDILDVFNAHLMRLINARGACHLNSSWDYTVRRKHSLVTQLFVKEHCMSQERTKIYIEVGTK